MNEDRMGAGRVWVVGDDVDTDQLAPGQWMKFDIPVIAQHCLESALPGFAGAVRPGDVLVAGRNFGCGSSREQAAGVLRALGVAAVLAPSFAGLFHRNALNLGLAALVCPDAAVVAASGWARLDLAAAVVHCEAGTVGFEPLPPFLREMLAAGGLLPQLKARLAAEAAARVAAATDSEKAP